MAENSGKTITTRTGYKAKSVETLVNQVVPLTGTTELHVTGTGDPIAQLENGTGISRNYVA